jgi:hypothetical protein
MKRSLAFSPRCLALCGLLAGALVAASGGCAGNLDPSLIPGGGGGTSGQAGSTGSVCDAPAMVFAPSCAQVGCHNASPTGGAGLDLASSGLVGRLLGQGPSTNTNAGALCMSAGEPYLKSGSNPAAGLLIDKMSQDTVTCGTVMPQIGTVSDTQVSCLKAWATAVTTGVITQ